MKPNEPQKPPRPQPPKGLLKWMIMMITINNKVKFGMKISHAISTKIENSRIIAQYQLGIMRTFNTPSMKEFAKIDAVKELKHTIIEHVIEELTSKELLPKDFPIKLQYKGLPTRIYYSSNAPTDSVTIIVNPKMWHQIIQNALALGESLK